MTRKKCERCQRKLGLRGFYIDRKTGQRESVCRECRFTKDNFDTEKYYLGALCKNKHDWDNSGRSLRYLNHRYCVICNRERVVVSRRNVCIKTRMVEDAKMRAKKKNLEFDLSKEFISQLNEIQDGRCVYTGIKLDWDHRTNSQHQTNRASLDRIDSSKGYTTDNVQLVTDLANKAKNIQNHKEFILFCKLIAERFKDTTKISN